MTVDRTTGPSTGRSPRVSLHVPETVRETTAEQPAAWPPDQRTGLDDDPWQDLHGDAEEDGAAGDARYAPEDPDRELDDWAPVDEPDVADERLGDPVEDAADLGHQDGTDDAVDEATDGRDAPEDTAPDVPPEATPAREPWWRRLAGPASVQVVTALQLVLAVAVSVVVSDALSATTKAGLVLALGAVVVLAAWPVGDRRAIVLLADLVGYLVRRVLARRSSGDGADAPAVLPPLVVGRADGPVGPEMGVVHDGAGWAAIAVVAPRGPLDGQEPPASWLPETVEALGREQAGPGTQVVLEQDGRGLETLVAVRVLPDSSPAGGVLGDVDGVAPLLRHRLRVVDDALEPVGLTVRTLDPAEVVGQLTRAFALDDGAQDGQVTDDDERLGEHRACVVSARGVEQVVTVRSSAASPAEVACELESLALRLPGRVTVAVDVEDGGWVEGAVMRVGVDRGTGAAALAAATRRAMPPGADLLVPHWRQGPRYAATLPLGRRP